MFKSLYFKIALIIFISCILVLGVTTSFVSMRNHKFIDSEINRQLNSVLDIDINTSPTSLNQFVDSTVFLYFEDSDEPFSQQKNYDATTYQKIYDEITSKDNYRGRVHVDKFYLAYKGKDAMYFDGSDYVRCREYVVYDYSLIKNQSDDVVRRANAGGIVGIFLFVIISLLLSLWFTKPLKDAHKREKTLLENASHELKTPVAILMSDLEVLKNNRNETIESQMSFVNSMSKQTDRMRYLIQFILNYSKMGSVVFEKADFDLSSVVNEVILTMETYAFEQKVTFESNIEPGITYHGVRQGIHTLVSTLVDNAVKYNRKNGKVFVNLYRKKKHVILEIKNNGKSIPKEDLDKIFDRFYRGDKTRNQKNQKSFGMGLSIAKAIVYNHKGKIKVESEQDLTTFTVIL